MMGKIVIGLIGTVVCCMLTGCGYNINSHIGPLLEPNYLDEQTGTEKINLSENGRCPTVTLLVNPINIETRTKKYVVYENLGVAPHYLVPKEFIEKTVQYLKIKMIESNLKVDEQSGKKILVSLEEATSNGNFTLETNVKLKIELPEIGYSQVYSGVEGSGFQEYATAYALHLAVMNFLNDSVFQKYVQCR